MFAGKVKLKNFLFAVALMGVGAGGLVAGALLFGNPPEPLQPTPVPVAAAPQANALVGEAANAEVLPMSEAAREVLSHRDDALPVDKVKDISPSRSYKVNLYQDPGHKKVNRAKVDLDRDEKWDEKYSFATDGTVSRELSPAENDEFPLRYLLDGERWVKDGATVAAAVPATPTTTATPATPGATGGRPVDQDVMAFQGKNIGSDKLKDAVKGKPYKVNVYQDAGEATANRAKVDLDRDDKWDEKFTFKDGQVTRDVAPADDEAYTEHYRWSGSAWERVP